MNTTKQQKKEKALEILKTLEVYKPYITGFNKEDKVCFFEQYGGYWVFQEPEIEQKMKEVEKKYNCLVYAITHEYTDFGECWDFLCVPDYEDEWEYIVEKYQDKYLTFAYTWNKTDEMCSELGTIAVKSFGGGIARVG